MVDKFMPNNYSEAEVGDVAFSSSEDMLTRTTYELLKGQIVAKNVEYSSQLEQFIRQIVREEIEKSFAAFSKGFIDQLKRKL